MDNFCRRILEDRDFIAKRTFYYLVNTLNKGYDIDKNLCIKVIDYIIEYWIMTKNPDKLRKMIKVNLLKQMDDKLEYFKKSNIEILLKSIKWSILDLIFKIENDYKKVNSYYIVVDNIFDELEMIIYDEWQKLTEEHMKFKVLAETMKSPLFIILNDRFKYVNLEGLSLFGYTEEEIKSINYLDMIHPDSRECVKENIKRLVNDGKSYENNYEIKILTKDFKEKWLALSTSTINIDGNKCITGVGIDITHKKDMEKQLEIFDKKMGNLMETINVGVELIKGNEIKYINSFMTKITGYDKDELMHLKLNDMLHQDFKRELDSLLNDDLYKTSENRNFRKEIKLIRKDKKEVWIDINAKVYSIDGQIYRILCFNDVTESKEVLRQLEKSKQTYKSILEILPNGVILEKEGKILYCNKCSAKTLGIENSKELLNMNINEVIELCDENQVVLNGLNNNCLIQGQNVFLRKKDNRKLDLEVKLTKGYEDDEDVTLVMFNDISHKKKIQQLQKRMEAKNNEILEIKEYNKLKTSFFSNISHELRTPLNVILGAVQLLKLIIQEGNFKEDKERVVRYIDIIKRNSFRMVKISNNLIDSAEIEYGHIHMNLDNNNIAKIVENMKDAVLKYAEAKNISIEFKCKEEKIYVSCDKSKIERVVLNVLSNAIKFTEDNGKIVIELLQDKKYVTIAIKDDGIGIPRDKQNIIFESFSRIDKSLSRSTEGTGMGLAIAKSLVEMHDGKISLESQEGKGSNFKIYLPNRRIKKISEEISNYIEPFGIEKVDIEFSDIYS
ncbi:PAS domain S-box protein [Haloimpatiens sp. FM7315]|uniref:PAS domain S-box protein n=1 Tax=Haloimpatiens sp. FM7315 TaxID=3298609 RepID=UPI0035A2A039